MLPSIYQDALAAGAVRCTRIGGPRPKSFKNAVWTIWFGSVSLLFRGGSAHVREVRTGHSTQRKRKYTWSVSIDPMSGGGRSTISIDTSRTFTMSEAMRLARKAVELALALQPDVVRYGERDRPRPRKFSGRD